MQVAREIILHFKDKHTVLGLLSNNQLLDLEKVRLFYEYLAVRRIDFKMSKFWSLPDNQARQKLRSIFDSLDQMQNQSFLNQGEALDEFANWDFIMQSYINKRLAGQTINKDHIQMFDEIKPHWLFTIEYDSN